MSLYRITNNTDSELMNKTQLFDDTHWEKVS